MKHLRLYLIRHGETDWALSGQHTSYTDIPLTEAGEEEARQLQEQLREVSFTHVFTSPRKRAQRTCELAGLSPVATIEPDLEEWNYGEYEGLRSAEIRKARPGWNVFRDGCPGGETAEQVSHRADRLIAHLRTFEGTIALFTHGQFGCAFAARWIGLPVINGQHFLLGTTSLNILSSDPNHLEVPVIALWNATSHEKLEAILCPVSENMMMMKERTVQRWENAGAEIPADHHELRECNLVELRQ